MRPVELTLEGFTSFRKRQRLDFSTLDLFAITGQTGAGKSSLLDAITFALYGVTIKKTKTEELVSQGASNLKVTFQFLVAGKEYRVTRTWRYRTSTPEVQVLLEGKTGSHWETLETKTSSITKRLEEDILRMNFDTFTRAILLPQSKFDEFLKGDTAKRRDLLRKMAGLEIFEKMREEANQRFKASRKNREFLEKQLAEIQAPSKEEIQQQADELSVQEQRLVQLEQSLSLTEKNYNEEERLLKSIERLARLNTSLQVLEAERPKILELEARLEKAQKADTLAAPWTEVKAARKQYTICCDNAKAANQKCETAEAELKRQEALLTHAKEEFTKLETQFQERERNLATVKVYEEQRVQRTQTLRSAENSLTEKQQKLKEAEVAWKTAQKDLERARSEAQMAEAALATCSPGGNRLEALNSVIPELNRWMDLEQKARKDQNQLEKIQQQKETTQKELEKSTLALQAAETELQAAQSALESTRKENERVSQLSHVAAVQMSLHPGDLCPVCGNTFSEEHPVESLPELVNLKPLQKRLELATTSQTQCNQVLSRLNGLLEGFVQSEKEWLNILKSNQQTFDELKLRIDQELEQTEWLVQDLIQEQKLLLESNRKHQAAFATQKELTEKVRLLEQRVQFTESTWISRHMDFQNAQQETEQIRSELQRTWEQLNSLTSGQTYVLLEEQLRVDRQTLNTRMEQVNQAYQNARSAALIAQDQAMKAVEVARQAWNQQNAINAAWLTKLQSLGFEEQTFLQAQTTPAEQAQWRESIEKYHRNRLTLNAQIEEVSSGIAGRYTDAEALEKLRNHLQEIKAQRQKTQQRITDLRIWLQSAQEKLRSADSLNQQYAELLEQESLYQILSQHLQGDKFQAYMLEFLQNELVARASVFLRDLTENRYTLRIRDGEFIVEDNWNGGESRSVKTLSGGETFAASLCMALALSERLSLGQELGSLFLDEGFGTLDAETLESVTQILESLRQRNRLIGIITHVQALGERLPVQVKVAKSPEGSTIQIVAA
jgi:exonuclease SbcC